VLISVTGASRGIGLGFALALAKRSDAVVYATVRETGKAEQLEQASQANGNLRIVPETADDEASSAKLAEKIKSESGHLDAVIACAGTSLTRTHFSNMVMAADGKASIMNKATSCQHP
jgi:NAD(P)-dependent dehydrogenase (short-subunit alcohol dehydrogenase family)